LKGEGGREISREEEETIYQIMLRDDSLLSNFSQNRRVKSVNVWCGEPKKI